MIEKLKNKILWIGFIALCALFICSLTGNIITGYCIHKYRRTVQQLELELGQYRTRIDELTDTEQSLTRTIARAGDITRCAENAINSIGNSIQAIRTGLSKLEAYVKDLEECLFGNNSSGDSECSNSGDSCELDNKES